VAGTSAAQAVAAAVAARDPFADTAAPRELLGFVDTAAAHRVTGWVCDPSQPNTRLTVWIEVNGAIVGSGVADQFRQDLAQAGHGDGCHAFNIPLPGTGPHAGDELRCLVSGAPAALRLGLKATPEPVPLPEGKAATPVFILGSPRSGTTILAGALEKAGYFGFGEGHLLDLLVPIRQSIQAHFSTNGINDPGLLIGHIDQGQLLNGIARAIAEFQTRFNPSEFWFDKTPGPAMIYSAGVLLRLWPTASFVFAKRRGIETIVSRLKKFSGQSFEQHCRSWSETMAVWRRVREARLRAIEIDQYDIARDPSGTASRLGAFLRVGEAATTRIRDEMAHARPQRSDEGSTERVLTLATCGWSDEQIATFRRFCIGEMQAYGYRLDDNYRDEGSSA